MRHISIETIEGKGVFAITKARADVNTITREMGFRPLVLGSTSPIGFYRVLRRHYDILSLRWKLRRSDRIFFQFPWIHNSKPAFYRNLLRHNGQMQCVIHDLDSLRYQDDRNRGELEYLSQFSSIIAHTPAMKQFLVEHGIEADKIKLLYTFPYLTTDPIHRLNPADKPTIIFAGNLLKSPFVSHLKEIADDDFRFHLYGNGAEQFEASTQVVYKGMFQPDHPGCLEGNWGLVWDGPELNTCSGLGGGDYLRYNSSHKISLYLSLGIPVILWSQSSLKEYVGEHNLGITVDSLYDLKEKIASLSQEQIASMQESAQKYAPLLRSGEILKKLIEV